MKIFFPALISIIVISCLGKARNPNVVQDKDSTNTSQIQIKEEKKQELKIEVDTLKLSGDIDSVHIWGFAFGYYSVDSFNIYLSNINFEIDNDDNDERKKIKSLSERNELTAYINEFYIDKTEKIVLSERLEPSPVSDYPFIRVIGFKNNKKVFTKDVRIYPHLMFNPKFMEFYEFIDSLLSEYNSRYSR